MPPVHNPCAFFVYLLKMGGGGFKALSLCLFVFLSSLYPKRGGFLHGKEELLHHLLGRRVRGQVHAVEASVGPTQKQNKDIFGM